MSSGVELPIGTVTFLFTDIEGSTQLLKRLGGERYGEALADHQQILRESVAEHGGHEIDTQGDSFFVAFRRAKDGVSAAVASQRRLAEHEWPDGADLRVRMGIHTGEPVVGGTRYVGLGVHRAARICAAGHGGQVLLSQTARELLRDDPIPDVTTRDLGEHRLKDLDEPERLYQLVAPGLRQDFPPLKTAATTPFEGREGELAEAAAEELAKGWRSPGRRALILATFGAAVVAAALVALFSRGGGAAEASIAPNAVGVIDADSGEVASEIEVGGAPADIAVGGGGIWVANANDNTVSRIDPSTNDVRQTIRVGGGPAGIAAGGGAVWVANGLDGTVSRIDPTTNDVVQTVFVGNGPSGVAYGEGAVWVTSAADGTLSRINPESGVAAKPFPAAVGASGLAIGFGRVWVVSPSAASLVALDPRSGRVLKRIGVGGEPSAVAAGAGALWVANRADGTVSKINPRTAAVVDTVSVGRAPEAIAAGQGGVWVANGGDATVVRLDSSSGELVKTIALDNPARGVALAPQGVYVAVQSTGIEHRGGTLRVLAAFGVDSLDPGASGFEGVPVRLLTHDGLVSFRKVGGVEGVQLTPDLAVALPAPTDGGKTYTFEVRRGIRYSNGELVQPEDFKHAIERIFAIGAGDETYFAGIVGADRCTARKPCDLAGIVVDRAERTVTFRLTAPDAEFPAKLALPFAVAVPARTPARDLGARPTPGTGPYRISEFDKDKKTIRLVRNRFFREWSADAQPQGFPNSIMFSWRFGVDGEKRFRAVERGAADLALGDGPPLPEEKLEAFAVQHPSQLRSNTVLGTFYFFLNTRIPPFDDVRVRRAVNSAFDREGFAKQLGRGVAPTCQILPPNLPGYRPSCSTRSGGVGEIESARGVIRRAGAAGAAVTVWAPRPVAHEGRYMVTTLTSLGFRARLRSVADPGAYFETVSDSRLRAQAGWAGWAADVPSAAGFIPGVLGCKAFAPASPGQSNLAEFCDRSIDAQIDQAIAVQVQDPAAAITLWQEVERRLLAQAPIVPAYNRSNIDFVAKRVGNYQYNAQWGVLLSQLWVK